MLEFYFKYPKVLKRLRSGTLGGEMDRIAAHLAEIGYKHASAKVYISQLGRFSEFAARYTRVGKINQNVIDLFMRSLQAGGPRIAARTAIEHARRAAPERFSAPDVMPDPDAPLLAAYLDHLRRVRGLAPKTCEGLHLAGRRILAWHRSHLPDQPLEAMTGEHTLDLTLHLLSLSSNDRTRSSMTAHARAFLRFLHWSGIHDQDLARFVPRTPCYRLSYLPPRLAWRDIQRAIDAIDVTTPAGMRDRALLLLLATTGLRNKELRSLELQNPLADSRGAGAPDQRETRSGCAALAGGGQSARRLCVACQTEGRELTGFPVSCTASGRVQVQRRYFQDRAIPARAKRT